MGLDATGVPVNLISSIRQLSPLALNVRTRFFPVATFNSNVPECVDVLPSRGQEIVFPLAVY